LRLRSARLTFPQEDTMANGKRGDTDRIGTPDPDHEPTPPRIDSAGELGEVGERKLEQSEDKRGIWGSRPSTPDEDPKDPAARKPAPSR
jgi:hypothetical protein